MPDTPTTQKRCVFILSHGRPDGLKTLRTLQKYHYKGDWLIVLDDQDPKRDKYIKRYGANRCVVFDKKASAKKSDLCDNFPKLNTVLIARNECWEIARKRGITHFVELDDDYTDFLIRVAIGHKLAARKAKDLTSVFNRLWDFLDQHEQVSCVAMMQAGDFIGGAENYMARAHGETPRKIMQTFFVRTDRPFLFKGRMNDDVNTYVTHGNKGTLFLSFLPLCVVQTETQANAGGLTEMYLELGTFVKSFYTCMICPSAVVVKSMGRTHMRLHHLIHWGLCTPKLISSRYKK